MATFLMRRVFQGIIFVAIASLLIYSVLVMLMPQGPAQEYNFLKNTLPQDDGSTDPLDQARLIHDLEQTYKLDKPWPLNFLVWLFDPNDTVVNTYDIEGNPVVLTKGIDIKLFGLELRGSGILTASFGTSTGYSPDTPFSDIFANRWLNTLTLVSAALALALLVGVPLGILGALHPRSRLDHTLTFLSLGGLSIPPFVLGLMLIIFLAVAPKALHDQNATNWLPWLPPGGVGDPGNFWSGLSHLVLPATTLAVPIIARISRFTRASMLDVLSQDFIRTAWAKGLGRSRVIYKHALRNTLSPIITQIIILIPAAISGAMVVETAFAYEGLGKVFYRAMGGCLDTVSNGNDPPLCPRIGYYPIDYPLALALLFIMVLIVATCSLVGDILYTATDPRITFQRQE